MKFQVWGSEQHTVCVRHARATMLSACTMLLPVCVVTLPACAILVSVSAVMLLPACARLLRRPACACGYAARVLHAHITVCVCCDAAGVRHAPVGYASTSRPTRPGPGPNPALVARLRRRLRRRRSAGSRGRDEPGGLCYARPGVAGQRRPSGLVQRRSGQL